MGAAREVVRVNVGEGFRRWAEVYDQIPNPVLALEERLLAPQLADVGGCRVVDVGCGTGRWLARLAPGGAKALVGIDSSAEMLRRAQRKLCGALSLAQSTCTAIPLQDACADIILCSFTIGYTDRLGDVARELARICKPGGHVYVSELHPDTHARGWRRGFRHAGQEIEVANVAHSVAKMTSMFSLYPLDIVDIQEACFGEQEREFFVRAGKANIFDENASAPAIVLAHFRRRATKKTFAGSPRRGFRLSNARIAVDANETRFSTLNILDGRIVSADSRSESVDLSGYLLLPGLINAHDHLEFNLFPRLGTGPYANFLEWASDIHNTQSEVISEHREVDKLTRLYWGAIKNLFAGVTTVAHHNPYDREIFGPDFPVRVLRRYGWAHSVPLQKDIGAAFANTPADAPFIIHVGEGTDEASAREFDELARQGCLGPRTVLVHAVGLTAAQRKKTRDFGAAAVWCPSSNLFTLHKTLSGAEVDEIGRVALGTDSALTCDGDLRDEMRLALDLGISAARLYELVTTSAADVLRLSRGEGRLCDGAIADIIAIRDCGEPPTRAVCSKTAIELVMTAGVVRMISPELAGRWPAPLIGMEELCVNGVRRLVKAPVAGLLRRVERIRELRIAHKPVSQ